jgi:hypothetical protein
MQAKQEKNWKDSEAKRLLREDIISGVVQASMAAKDVYDMWPEYKKWAFKNFQTNLKNLCKAIANSYTPMLADCKAYGHDQTLLMTLRADENTQDIPWHKKSEAKKLLKQDIDDGKHKQMKPEVLHGTRDEYQAFPLKTFGITFTKRLTAGQSALIALPRKRKGVHLWALVLVSSTM